jgi:hypothetical protein
MKRLQDLSKVLLLMLLTGSMGGCFGFNVLFEQLDVLTVWQADRMLDLDAQQEDALEPAMIEIREWLRNDGLPAAQEALNGVDRRWSSGDLIGATEQFEQEGRVLGNRFLVYAWPRLSPLLLMLNENNAAAYESYTEERIPEWFAGSLGAEAKLEDRLERLEKWFGDLTDAQVDIVRKHTQWQEGEYELRVDNSRQWRKRFMDLVLARDMATLESVFTQPEQLQSPAYQGWLKEQQRQYKAMRNDLFAVLTPAQRTHASKRVQDWIVILQSVVGGNEATGSQPIKQ